MQHSQHWWTCELQGFMVACKVLDAAVLLWMSNTGMSPLPPGSEWGQGPGTGSTRGKLGRHAREEWKQLLQRSPTWTTAEDEPWHAAARHTAWRTTGLLLQIKISVSCGKQICLDVSEIYLRVTSCRHLWIKQRNKLLKKIWQELYFPCCHPSLSYLDIHISSTII